MLEIDIVFAAWIDRNSRSSPPPSGISAVNIGIFETPKGYKVHLTASNKYDPTDDDWACQDDYSPKDKYLELPVSFVQGKGWQEILEGFVNTVNSFLLLTKHSENVLTNVPIVTVGFDDGNLIRVK